MGVCGAKKTQKSDSPNEKFKQDTDPDLFGIIPKIEKDMNDLNK